MVNENRFYCNVLTGMFLMGIINYGFFAGIFGVEFGRESHMGNAEG